MAVGNGVPRMGYDSIMGVARETAYGTFVTATAFIEFNTESIKTEIEEKKLETIQGTRFYRRRLQGNQTTSGNIEANLNPASDAFCYVLMQAMGGTVSSSTIASGVMAHTFNVGNMESNKATSTSSEFKGISVSVRRGIADTFCYNGGRVNNLTIKGEVGNPVTWSAEMMFQGATTAATIPTATYTDTLPVNFTGVIISTADNLGSSATEYFQSFELTLGNNLNEHRVLGNRQPVGHHPARCDIKLKLAQVFDTITSYNRFIQNTSTTIRILMDSGVTIGGTGGTATTYACTIDLGNCYFNSNTPQVGDAGMLKYELDVSAIYANTATSAVRIYVNNATLTY